MDSKGEYQEVHDEEYQGEDEGQDTDDNKEQKYKNHCLKKESNNINTNHPVSSTHNKTVEPSLASSVNKHYREDWETDDKKAAEDNSSSEEVSDEDEEEEGEGEDEDEASQPDEDIYSIVETSPKGRFKRFNEKLGAGAYKSVYRGIDDDTGREIAWNVIKINTLPKIDRKRISEEIHTLKSMKEHPNIIHFISAWINRQKEEVVFITEMVTAGSLRQYLKKIKKPRLKVLKTWAIQILKGLQYLHELQPPIIHRDIKWDNIFINSNKGEIRIGDLGLSTSLNHSFTTSVLGTPEFMAPELYEEKYGVSVDIYAFGMWFLEMCTLSTPYKEWDNPAQIYKKVIQGIKPQAFERIDDPEVADFILSWIEFCNKRPSTTDLLESWFLKDLDSEKNNEPVKLVAKNKLKNVKHSREDVKRADSVVTPHTQEIQKVEEETAPGTMREGADTNIIKRKTNEQNEKESLDLFNKIEAAKNQRLNIDEEKLVTPEVEKETVEDPSPVTVPSNSNHREEVIERNLNKSTDNILKDRLPHQSHPHPDPFELERVNTSFDRHDNDPIENPHLNDAHNRDVKPKNLSTFSTHDNSNHTQGVPEQSQSAEEVKTNRKGIIWKLLKVLDAKTLKIQIVFARSNREISFEYNLEQDTPQGIWTELTQAGFAITEEESVEIQRSIGVTVNDTVGKIYKKYNKPSSNNQKEEYKTTSDKSVPNVENYHSSQAEQQNDPKTKVDNSEKFKKAEYTINHFFKTIETELHSISRYKNEIEQFNSVAANETWSISLQFINEVMESYQNFQHKLKKIASNKNKNERVSEAPSPTLLKQTQSFKNASPNPHFAPASLQKGGSSGNLNK